MKRWHLVMVMGWVVGCVAPSKEIGATVTDSEGEGETSGMSTSTTVEPEPTTSGGEATTSIDSEATTSSGEATTSIDSEATTSSGEVTTTSGTETTGGLESCEEAETEAQCDAFPDGEEAFFSCGWVPTVVYAGGGCEVVPDTGFEGSCVLTDQADTCGTVEDSTCPDGSTLVYFRELGLEIGAIELLTLESGVCSESTAGFEPCVVIDDGESLTYDPPECECACPA
jgi:hypothetical protein